MKSVPFPAPRVVVPRSILFLVGFLCALPGLLAENPSGIGPEVATEGLKAFTVPPGLEVSLFASEPFLRNPTDIDVDSRGRVWVAEGVNYRSTFQSWGILEPEGDRIVILEKTPGQAPKATVFYQDPSINAALGVCVLGNKVIVSVSPNVFVLTDTDGDGKADKRELMFTGISGVDHDHGVHAFVFGPDGKLYFNMGNQGGQLFYPLNRELPLHGPVSQVAMKPVVDLEGRVVNSEGHPYRMGMVFRCNLDGTQVETLGWNFRNNYEVAVDSFGTLWQSDNDDDGNRGVRINYVMEHGNFGYADEMTGAGWPTAWDQARSRGAAENAKVFYEWHQFDPGVVPDLLHTGAGAPTGIAVYEGNLLPPVFRNQLIHADAGSRVVRAYPVQPDGAGYRTEIANLLQTGDSWFRPSDVCVGPDGSLYVADWNDANVGGHNMADRKAETMTGRIYRLAPKGSDPSVPTIHWDSLDGCVQALQSPNLDTRYLAWTKLHAEQGAAEQPLLELWNHGEPRMRARALQLLARIPGRGDHYLGLAIQDADPDIRITALRIAHQLKLDLIPCVKKLVQDPSAQVRRECAISLRHLQSLEAAELWTQLAMQYDGHDRWYLEALGIGADEQWDRYLDAWLKAVGDRWNSPAGREIVWRSRSRQTPALLASILTRPNLPPAEIDHYFRSFDFVPGPEREAELVKLLTATGNSADEPKAIQLEALSRIDETTLAADPAVKAMSASLLNQTRGTLKFVDLVRAWGVTNEDETLLGMALTDPTSPAGIAATRWLLNTRSRHSLEAALAGTNALPVALALGRSGETEITPLLLPVVSDSKREITLRKQALRSLVNVKSGAEALLDLAATHRLPADLMLTARSELSRIRWPDLKTRAAQLLPMPKSLDAQPLPPISELIRMRGDTQRGAAVFQRDSVGCAKCHQVNGVGIDFGPNLSEIGTKLGKDALYESILDPSAGISFGYEAWQIELKGAEEAYGLIVSETPDEIAVKAVGGTVTRYAKANVVKRTQQKISIMPTGLEQAMTRQDLVDLVQYLSTLKKAPH